MPSSNPRHLPEPSDFVGRQNELEQLVTFFTSPPASGAVAVAVIVGPGGIGKTYLALEAAAQLGSAFPDGVIIINAAESRSASAVSLARRVLQDPVLASQRDVSEPDLNIIDDETIFQLYRQAISRHQFLLIIDQAELIADASSLLRDAAPSGFILATREAPRNLSAGLTLSLSGFSPEESRHFFGTILGDSQVREQGPAFDQIATMVQGIPLALALIVGLLKKGTSADSIARRMSESRETTSILGESTETARINRVNSVIQYSYDHLSEQSAHALRLLSAFGGLGFTIDLAADVLALNFPDAKAEVLTLERYAILSSYEPGAYKLHPLIQEFARKLLLTTEDETTIRRASEIAIRTLARHSLRSRTQLARDLWTTDDTLGYSEYARAVAEFIRHPETRAPLSIAIFGSWGAGKTSLMRMVQDRLDPRADRIRWTPSELALDQDSRSRLLRRGRHPPSTMARVFRPFADQRLRRSAKAPHVRSIDLLRTKSGHEIENSYTLRVAPPDGTRISDEHWRGTVWFNPWKYENSEQLWAGLANEIILQVTTRLNKHDRQAFWIDLNRRRFDKARVQQLMNRALFTRIIPSAVAAAVLLVLAFVGILVVHTLPSPGSTAIKATTGSATLVAAIALAFVVIRAVRLLTSGVEETLPFLAGPAGVMSPIKQSLQKVMEAGYTDPDYASRLGFLEFVHGDVTNVLDLIATDERPLVVFVDDLDRCSSSTISSVIEAINLFLAGEYRNCIFVLGLDPTIVTAHIESTYKDMVQALAAQGADMPGLGWSFLDKFVQLPLILPRPQAEALKTVYMSALLQSEEARDSVQSTPDDSQRRYVQESNGNSGMAAAAGQMDQSHKLSKDMMSESRMGTISKLEKAMAVRAPNLETLPLVAHEVELDVFGNTEASLRPETLEAASRIFAGLYSDTSVAPSIHRGLTWLESRNPREIKRFVNLFRFYYFLAEQHRLHSERITADEVAKVAALIIRWPQILGRLLVGTEKSSVLDRLESWVAGNAADKGGSQVPVDEGHIDPSEEWHHLLLDCDVVSATGADGNSRLAVQLHRFLSETPTIAHAINVLL